MKRTLILLTFLACCCAVPAKGQAPTAFRPASIGAETPAWFYCEIIGSHLPGHRGNGVLFDFGQKTEAWAYNWLTDAEGRRLIFNSGIEALNYMVSRGWEFVQAYTSGEENQTAHFLLRIAASRLSEAGRETLLAAPPVQKAGTGKPKKGKQ